MTTQQDLVCSSPVATRLDTQHPVLANQDLPVEIEDAPKPSGSNDLDRGGLDEEGMSFAQIASVQKLICFEACRDFLVRLLGHVPRNYNYGDGLKIIYPKLQERFGDENLDLSIGVLHERRYYLREISHISFPISHLAPVSS